MIIIRSLSKYFGKLLALMSKANRTIYREGVPVYSHYVKEFFQLFEQDDAAQSFFGYMKILSRLRFEGVRSFDAHQLRTVSAVVEEIDRHFSLERKSVFGYFSRDYSVIEQIDKTFPLNYLETFLFPGAVKEGLMCLLFRHLFDPQSPAGSDSFSVCQLIQATKLGSKYLSVDIEVGTLLMLITFAIHPPYLSFGGSYEELTNYLGLGQVSTALLDELNEIKICTEILHLHRKQIIRGREISVVVQNYSIKDCPRTFRVLLVLNLLNRLDEDAKALIAGKNLIPLEDDTLDYLIKGFYDFDWRINDFRPIPMELGYQFVPAQLRHQPKSLAKLFSMIEDLDLLNAKDRFLNGLPIFAMFNYYLNAEDRRTLLHVCTEDRIPKVYLQMLVWLIMLGRDDDFEAIRSVTKSISAVLILQDLVEDIPRCIELYFSSNDSTFLLEKKWACLELALHSAIELFRRQDVKIRDADGLLDNVCLRMVSALRTDPPKFALLQASYPEFVNDILWLRGQVRDSTQLKCERLFHLIGLHNMQAVRICTLTAMCFPAIQLKLRPNAPRTWLRHCPLRILVQLNQFL